MPPCSVRYYSEVVTPQSASIHPSLVREMKSLLGATNVLDQREDLLLYEFDGSVEKALPDLVVFPHTTAQVSQIVKLAAHYEVPVVGRQFHNLRHLRRRVRKHHQVRQGFLHRSIEFI